MRAAYEALVAAAELRPDAAQAAVADHLQALADALEAPAPRLGPFARLFAGLTGAAPPPVPQGLYIWGGVGRGKSMLMDLFFSTVAVQPKRRVHFHEFMLEVHADLHAERQKGGGDPIPGVAATIAASARLLAFDEMQVKDIADAAIVSRLFAALFTHGVTVVTTSNRVPEDLYYNGLNRQLFTPFIGLLRAHCSVITLDGPVDYRLERLGGAETWHVPNGPAANAALATVFFRMTDYPVEDRARVPSEILPVPGGRTLFVPKSLKGTAVFSFARLCRKPLGAADYLAIARHYHTVFVMGIPVMGPENRNEATRFITLVDALYEYKVKLLASADAQPSALYPVGDGVFEFDRTVSRLMEMQSADYMALGHGEPG